MIIESVFLDTNFLVASQLKNHPFHQKTKTLRKLFILDSTKVYISPLVFDEFWYVMMGVMKNFLGADYKIKLHKILKKATANVLSFPNLVLLDLIMNGGDLLKILNTMFNLGLKPRDALILSIMKANNVVNIATFDAHFKNIRGIKVLD